jgi:uncharacterized protein (TIGR03437 family)
MKSAKFLCFLLSASLAVLGAERWIPAPQTSWQWQLQGEIDQSVNAEMFDVDLFDTSPAVIAALHAKGSRVVCYMSAGTFEPWRTDAALFPDAVKGSPVSGWPDERWLDIRRLDVLGPIMEARLDLCKSKGFDAVEPDNIDAYTNRSGFPLTGNDQLRFNRFLADAAHARGLSIGLKNDLDQIPQLVSYFDWALNEQCFQYKECDTLLPFVKAGKAVFNAEYKLEPSAFCAQANALNFNSLFKKLELDAWVVPCREPAAAGLKVGTVVNAASMVAAGIVPGEAVRISGQGFGPPGQLFASFDGVPATTVNWNSTQALVIVPAQVAGKPESVLRVSLNDSASSTLTIPVRASDPALYSADGSGRGQVNALNENGSANSTAKGAWRGSVVTFWGTGAAHDTLQVWIGGVQAQVLQSASADRGAFKLTVLVPSTITPGIAVPVALSETGSGDVRPALVTLTVTQ